MKIRQRTPGQKHTAVALGILIGTFMPLSHAQQPDLSAGDDASIIVGGTVVAQIGDTFTLDYGTGSIIVEMDDWDAFNEARMISPGETVTVRGVLDDDLFETRKIEARSVYVQERQAKYFAQPMDEEDALDWSYGIANPEFQEEGTWYSLSGTITHIDGTEFLLDTGANVLEVETAFLDYNPMDDTGYQQLHVGDFVHVAGRLDEKVFENNEINAMAITSFE